MTASLLKRAALLALLALLPLVLPATAQATPSCRTHYVRRIERRHGHIVRRHHRIVWVRVRRTRCIELKVQAPVAAPAPPMIGVGDAPNCLTYGADPTPYLRAYSAQILRVIIAPGVRYGGTGSAVPCIQAAYAAGYKIHLAVQYLNSQTPQEAADFYRQVLPMYAPYLWAVSIGNEQELDQGGVKQNGQQYAAYWRVLEPIVAQLVPNAIRVAGEISPWGLKFLTDALSAGLPGAQAIAAHPYAWPPCFEPAQLVNLGRFVGLPVWFTEGLQGPSSWGPDRPIGQLTGAAVADAWWG